MPYRKVCAFQDLDPGVYIFADLERLQPGLIPLVASVRAALVDAGQGRTVLNDPAGSALRRALLTDLHDAGINGFRARACDELDGSLRYPVFVRKANDHDGPRSRLLATEAQLRTMLAKLIREGFDPRDLLVVEFMEVADASGIRRKYGAFRVGDRIVPGHLVFSRTWVQKNEDLVDDEKIAEEHAYLESNPHAEELMALFERARIEYGRIDYGVVDGRIQVWEINTNPVLIRARKNYDAGRMPIKAQLAARLLEALESVEARVEPHSEPIPWRFTPATLGYGVEGR